MRRFLILLLLVLVSSTSAFAQFDMQQIAVMQGESEGVSFGRRLAGIGDINNDGSEDLVIGQSGKTFVFFGSKNFDTIPDATFLFSCRYISSGDVNGDRIKDLLLGLIPLAEVLIYYGGSFFDTIPDKILVSPDTIGPPITPFGTKVASGDINKDGYDDLAIHGNNTRVYVYWGSANMSTAPAYILQGPPNYFGSDGLAIGDVNWDGYGDIAVSTSEHYPNDSTYIYFGGVQLDTIPRLKLKGGGVILGDINGDGYADIITTNGTYFGGTLVDSTVDIGIRSLGCSSIYWTTVGEFDKDRFEDLLLGSTSIVGGDASIYLGGNPLDTIVDWHYRDYQVGDYGAQVAAADINGDGVDEAIVGDPGWWYNNPSYPPGRVYIYKNPYTSVEDEQNPIPHHFVLYQNYPNPFNPSTTIPFQVSSGQWSVVRLTHTTLKIYNIRGQLVRTLVDEEKMPGDYRVIWDGRDNIGKEVTSGVYFYQLKAGDFSDSKKLLLIK